MPHEDALVIEAVIHNFRVQKVLVDDGSKMNLLPYRENSLRTFSKRSGSGQRNQKYPYDSGREGKGSPHFGRTPFVSNSPCHFLSGKVSVKLQCYFGKTDVLRV